MLKNVHLKPGTNGNPSIWLSHHFDDSQISLGLAAAETGLEELEFIVGAIFGDDVVVDRIVFEDVELGTDLSFQIIFHDAIEQAEFIYDSNENDEQSGRSFGPFDFSGSTSATQWTFIDFTAPTGSTTLEATLDHWSLRRLSSGDLDYSGVLNARDIDILSAEVRAGNNDLRRDLILDNLVNEDDRDVWVKELKSSFFGDANLDGEFNTTDLAAVFQAGEYEDGFEGNSSWPTGDWNGDTEFDSSDLVFAFQDGGFEIGPPVGAIQSVPERTSSGVVLLPFLALLWRRPVN